MHQNGRIPRKFSISAQIMSQIYFISLSSFLLLTYLKLILNSYEHNFINCCLSLQNSTPYLRQYFLFSTRCIYARYKLVASWVSSWLDAKYVSMRYGYKRRKKTLHDPILTAGRLKIKIYWIFSNIDKKNLQLHIKSSVTNNHKNSDVFVFFRPSQFRILIFRLELERPNYRSSSLLSCKEAFFHHASKCNNCNRS